MSMSSKAEAFVKERSISVNNVQELAKEFCGKLSLTNDERDTVNIFTCGQRENQSWFEMRHLMVTAQKSSLFTSDRKPLKKIQKLMLPLQSEIFYVEHNHGRNLQSQFSMA